MSSLAGIVLVHETHCGFLASVLYSVIDLHCLCDFRDLCCRRVNVDHEFFYASETFEVVAEGDGQTLLEDVAVIHQADCFPIPLRLTAFYSGHREAAESDQDEVVHGACACGG